MSLSSESKHFEPPFGNEPNSSTYKVEHHPLNALEACLIITFNNL